MTLLATNFEQMAAASGSAEESEAALTLLVVHLYDAWADGEAVDGLDGALLEDTAGIDARIVRAARRALDALRAGDPRIAEHRATVCLALTELALVLARAGMITLANTLIQATLRHAALRGPESRATLYTLLRGVEWLRRQAAFTRAGQMADIVEAAAVDLRRPDARLHAHFARGNIIGEQGNLRRASEIIAEVESAAAMHGFEPIRCLAVASRAASLLNRGQVRESVAVFLAAVPGIQDPHDRANLLNGLGVAFMLLGHREAARDTLELALGTTDDVTVRSRAQLNLMRLAADFGDREAFDRYRHLLFAGRTEVRMRAPMYCMMGEAYHLFGDVDRARQCFERAMELAREHGVNQWIFTAEQGLAALDAGTPPVIEPEPLPFDDVAPAMARVRELRTALPGARR